MRRLSRSLLGIWVIGMGLGGSAPAQAASGVGPYYAIPAWDQTLPAATRFIVLTNMASAAVLDRETGLVWEQSPDTASPLWSTARIACANKTVGNRKGWRLPSMPELASLIDPSVPGPGPTLPPGHPFLNVLSAVYWSATTDVQNPSHAWAVRFIDSDVAPRAKVFNAEVWCVRSGMHADAY